MRDQAKVLDKQDNSIGEGSEPADSITASSPEKRPRGRPKGSRSKLALESRQVLAKHGAAVFERICRVALGKPVYAVPDEGGRRTKRYPSEAAEMACQKIVADRLLPALKAIESSGPDGAPLADGEPENDRQVARAVLALFRSGVTDATVHVAGSNESLVRVPRDQAHWVGGEEITDADRSAVSGDDVDAGGADRPSPSAPSLDDLPDLPNAPFYPGQTWRPWVGSGYFIQCIDGAALWRVVSAKGVLVGEDHPNVRVAAAACLDLAGPRPVLPETSKKQEHWT